MNYKLKITILEKFRYQKSFAKQIGMQEATLSRIINGHQAAGSETAKKIAEALNHKSEELFPNS